MRGDIQHPCVNNYDISMAMRGNMNCNIYTRGLFEVNEQNLIDAKVRNIKFIGINELRRNNYETN